MATARKIRISLTVHHKCDHTKLQEQSKQIHSGLAWPWEVGGENDARNGTVVEDVI